MHVKIHQSKQMTTGWGTGEVECKGKYRGSRAHNVPRMVQEEELCLEEDGREVAGGDVLNISGRAIEKDDDARKGGQQPGQVAT